MFTEVSRPCLEIDASDRFVVRVPLDPGPGYKLYTMSSFRRNLSPIVSTAMTDTCCEYSNPAVAKTARCPVNGKLYPQVGIKTVLHHVKRPWTREIHGPGFYFCDDPDCDVVYFDANNHLLRREAIRIDVGQKSRHARRAVCYCFDMTQADIENDLLRCRQFVVQRTRDAACDCEIRNPSGKCCLKDFPRATRE